VSEKKTEAEDYKKEMARRVPRDVAGPVLIAIVFIVTSPFILQQLRTDLEIFCYLLFLGIIAICVLFPMSLHAISNYHERERKLTIASLEVSPSKMETDEILKREIKKAAEYGETQNEER
jgi:hypothetical protein